MEALGHDDCVKTIVHSTLQELRVRMSFFFHLCIYTQPVQRNIVIHSMLLVMNKLCLKPFSNPTRKLASTKKLIFRLHGLLRVESSSIKALIGSNTTLVLPT